MTPTKSPLRFLLTLVIFVVTLKANAQVQMRLNSSIPIYRSAQDSIQLAAIDQILEQQSDPEKAKSAIFIDSILDLRNRLVRDGILRYKNLYDPSYDYTLVDSLEEGMDLSRIYRISIHRKSAIPEIVYQCKNLEQIEFVNTKIRKISKELAAMPRLKKIYIYNNTPGKPLKLPKNSSVIMLSIQGTDAQHLPKSYKGFKELATLELVDNNLTRFPNGARKNKKLKDFSLQRNALTLKENNIRKHKFLERLALHENKIKVVPSSIKNFPNLKKLNFNRNGVYQVSNAIGKLSKLEQLSFYYNELTSIPEGTYQLKNLKDLDLFHNQIESIGPGFAAWTKLQNLFLSHNKIISLPENIDTLKNLEGIYAWDNRIGSLPESIGNISGLKYLRVNRNYIKVIPASISELTLMEEFDIAHNYVSDLPSAILHYPNLKMLSIVDNPWNESTQKLIAENLKRLRDKDVALHITD